MADKAGQIGADLRSIAQSIHPPLDAVAGDFASVGPGHLQVNHDNVLQAGKVIQAQVDQLNDMTRRKLRDLQPGNIGDDDVSAAATKLWGGILGGNPDSYVARIGQYIDGLENLANQLKAAAKQYGYTEEQIADAFGAS
jgi:hypothetical protein